MAAEITDLRDGLRRLLGDGAGFRAGQEAAIRSAFVERRDTLAIFPTGGGKSLLYMLPASMSVVTGVVVVIQPLLSLVVDQVEHALDWDIEVEQYHSKVDAADIARIEAELEEGILDDVGLGPQFGLFLT